MMHQPPEMASRSSYSAMGQDRYDYEPCYGSDKVWPYGAGLHCHDFYELYIHLHGLKYYCIDNKVYELEPNQLIIVPPFTVHGHIGAYTAVDYERVFLYITPSLLKSAGGNLIDLNGFFRKCAVRGQYRYQMDEEDAKACTGLIKDMIAGLNDTTPVGRFTNYSKMLGYLQLVCKTVHRSNQEAQSVVVNEPMQDVLSFINDHFAQPLKLETLARQFGVSVSYLSHEFGKYTGRSVYDYILYRRILQAKEMINSGMNLNETAYRCGFSDYSSFLRSFKKMTGMSPNAYRKMAKNPTVDRLNK